MRHSHYNYQEEQQPSRLNISVCVKFSFLFPSLASDICILHLRRLPCLVNEMIVVFKNAFPSPILLVALGNTAVTPPHVPHQPISPWTVNNVRPTSDICLSEHDSKQQQTITNHLINSSLLDCTSNFAVSMRQVAGYPPWSGSGNLSGLISGCDGEISADIAAEFPSQPVALTSKSKSCQRRTAGSTHRLQSPAAGRYLW